MPEHLRAMREALDTRPKGERPTLEQITAALGPFSSASDGTEPAGCGHDHGPRGGGRRGGRRRG
jgi:5-methyltetrahydrofolate--homocysteine methyltransferase